MNVVGLADTQRATFLRYGELLRYFVLTKKKSACGGMVISEAYPSVSLIARDAHYFSKVTQGRSERRSLMTLAPKEGKYLSVPREIEPEIVLFISRTSVNDRVEESWIGIQRRDASWLRCVKCILQGRIK